MSLLLAVVPFFFHIAQKYRIKKAFLYDVNEELILCYRVIQSHVNKLIKELSSIQENYYLLSDSEKHDYFYRIRDEFNLSKATFDYHKYSKEWIERTASLIFLNKTCYNGLYRVNRQGSFNVPFGRYKKPAIFDSDNLKALAKLLKIAVLKVADFESVKSDIREHSFVYYDPPYKPISRTASFVSYSKAAFDDQEQLRLANLYKELSDMGVKQLLSNSDPKNEDPANTFFEDIYQGFFLNRVKASRAINCNGSKRGKITELLITNY